MNRNRQGNMGKLGMSHYVVTPLDSLYVPAEFLQNAHEFSAGYPLGACG